MLKNKLSINKNRRKSVASKYKYSMILFNEQETICVEERDNEIKNIIEKMNKDRNKLYSKKIY